MHVNLLQRHALWKAVVSLILDVHHSSKTKHRKGAHHGHKAREGLECRQTKSRHNKHTRTDTYTHIHTPCWAIPPAPQGWSESANSRGGPRENPSHLPQPATSAVWKTFAQRAGPCELCLAGRRCTSKRNLRLESRLAKLLIATSNSGQTGLQQRASTEKEQNGRARPSSIFLHNKGQSEAVRCPP
eukprot:scaffold25182_cov16-Tisochrysis_lutea.AAC.1